MDEKRYGSFFLGCDPNIRRKDMLILTSPVLEMEAWHWRLRSMIQPRIINKYVLSYESLQPPLFSTSTGYVGVLGTISTSFSCDYIAIGIVVEI